MYLIADTITRIKNANIAGIESVDVQFSNLIKDVLQLLNEKEYVGEVKVYKDNGHKKISVQVLPGNITDIKVVSKPGKRVYANLHTLKSDKRNLGLTVVSTPKGVLSKGAAIKQGVGGEVICKVW